jgi:2-dehydropantoate 2-reductase
MRIAVYGSGGVGGYFGGRLAQAGEEVTFIARGAHLEAIQKHGLTVKSIKGDFHIQPAQATDDPAKLGEVDVILLGVKAWQVPEAAHALRPLVGKHTFVVPLQNGVEAPEQLAAVLGKAHVLGGMCQISVLLAAPGEIRHVGIEPYVAFGELDGAPSPRAENLRQAFLRAGVNAEVPANILVAMWTKFMFIASISGMGAVTRAPVGVVRSLPETRELLVHALKEVQAVAQARGVNLPEDAVERRLAFIDSLPVGVLASMQRDIADGRPSELESQNGAVVRMGRQFGVPTPVHEFLYACLLPQEKKARGELSY